MRVRARWAGETHSSPQPIEQPVVSLYLDTILFSLLVAGRVGDSIQLGSTTDQHHRWRVGPNVDEAQPVIWLKGSGVCEILIQPMSPIDDLRKAFSDLLVELPAVI